MTCPRCGGNVPSGAKSCGTCGAIFTYRQQVPTQSASRAQQPAAAAKTVQQKSKPKGAFRWWQIPLALFIFFLGFGFGLSANSGAPTTDKKEPAKTQPSSESPETKKDESSQVEENSAAGEPSESDELYKITYQTHDVYVNSIGNLCCDVIIEIENTSKYNLFLDSPSYDFEDSEGKLLGTSNIFSLGSEDPDIIAPGEKGYYYANGAPVDGTLTADMDYVFVPHLNVRKSKNDIVRYEVSDLSLTEGEFGNGTITGRITNNTDEDDKMVWASIMLYNADGNPIGIFGTNVHDVNAGATVSFSASALPVMHNVKYADIADYKVIAAKKQYQFD